jgi:hypothetical protein
MRLRQQHFGVNVARPLKQQQLYSGAAGVKMKWKMEMSPQMREVYLSLDNVVHVFQEIWTR